MKWSRQHFEEAFEGGSKRLAALSEHWRTHTNRRTILTLIFAGVLATTLYVSVIQPPEYFPLNTLVTVPPGASLSETADSLEAAGVVRSSSALKLFVRLMGHERDIHAGDYLFRKPEDVFTVARAISKGYYGLEPIRIRIPEGATAREMAHILGNYLERFDEVRFVEMAEREEGYLFPDTYFFMPNTTDEQVILTMRQNFETHIKLIGQEIVAFGKPLQDVVIMASLLEREAKDPLDRRKIAGVLWNRIKRGMLLQVDATFIYTIGKGTFDLTLHDLRSDDPYNTYVHKGLPPGAIGSPSLDALLAAVTPIDHDYYFYLADHEHVTHYSETYEEHLEKKRQYLGG